ncbi:Uncharacterized protein BM_BM858 [Brugia malayi]|uniref:Bm858 n=1 Tax=Brugia malayi TaxID=6279 RepID=A0A0J9Y4L8_BRUMA|nr:Uncharacterized protein BM_BM858 [Brugia malayi]CDQ01503.1 Bm858 [Brugia malayi]VIO93960.1 Uncharacterized protein BM_BM858 [Brugia malayi]
MGSLAEVEKQSWRSMKRKNLSNQFVYSRKRNVLETLKTPKYDVFTL